MRETTRMTWFPVALALITLVACGGTPPEMVGDGGDPRGDGGGTIDAPASDAPSGDAPSGDAPSGPLPRIRDVDILLMVDNSGSMAEEQVELGRQIERMFDVLTTGDLDKDGVPDFEQAESVRFGVVSSDMGVGREGLATCPNGFTGDDGVLQSRGRVEGCSAEYPAQFLTFNNGGETTVPQFAGDARCIATLGTGGCGVEQQLEAVLKALTPSTSPIRFHGDTVGHGDGANAGFLRDDSLLVIISLTDEDDCSTPNSEELFSPYSAVYTGDLNLRCWAYPEALYPISRYVDGLVALRPDPRLLLFATIAGVPEDLVVSEGRTDFEAILRDPRMVEEPDSMNPTALTPACVSESGVAYPARRLVTLAQEFEERGAGGIVQSICQADYAPVIDAVLERVGSYLSF